jgi:ribosomal protein L11 methyltransferase
MVWQKLSFTARIDLIEPITELLQENGAEAVTLSSAQQEELFEPLPETTPLWQQTQISSLFAVEIDLQPILTLLKLVLEQSQLEHTIEILSDQDWQKKCTDAFPPICFANKLWIAPSWGILPQDNIPRLLLDPGLAFGTGSHPTTALCLEWLAQNIRAGEQVIDYGCGSGILALAAIKLGAAHCWAVDNDRQAIEATSDNASRNSISSQQLHAVLPEQLPLLQADTLIANILANTLVNLSLHLLSLIKPGGRIVLAGLLEDQIELVKKAYVPRCTFLPPKIKEEWVILEATII